MAAPFRPAITGIKNKEGPEILSEREKSTYVFHNLKDLHEISRNPSVVGHRVGFARSQKVRTGAATRSCLTGMQGGVKLGVRIF